MLTEHSRRPNIVLAFAKKSVVNLLVAAVEGYLGLPKVSLSLGKGYKVWIS